MGHSKPDLTGFLGKWVHMEVDRPLGSANPRHPDIVYPVNYGYIPGTVSGDGMPVDVYLLGIVQEVMEADALVIALIVREDDTEDKLVASLNGTVWRIGDVEWVVHFQERYFHSTIVMVEVSESEPGAGETQYLTAEQK